tara:strand:- start:164 stop:274 length:111 start_codon:yes stop_codon:yes gene_type:complete
MILGKFNNAPLILATLLFAGQATADQCRDYGTTAFA